MSSFGKFLKKGTAVIVTAAAFGAVAGGTFNYVTDGRVIIEAEESEDTLSIEDAFAKIAQSKFGVTDESDGKGVDVDIPTTSLVDGNDVGMGVSDIAKAVMPSVVSIDVTATQNNWYYGQVETTGSGSGIIIGKNQTELLIVTNNHVVSDANTVNVVFVDGESYKAAVKGTDVSNDLAVVSVNLSELSKDTLSKIEVAKIGSSDDVLVGEQVVAIGNALGYGQSVTTGIVSAKDRIVDTNTTPLIQTDAAINPGNSGGALLNMKGEVIGINSSKYASTEVEGMGYAIPISKVESIIDTLKTRKTRTKIEDENKRGYLGIKCSTISEEASAMYNMPTGVYVNEVMDNSAADKAGIEADCIITEFDGQAVTSANGLIEMLQYYGVGEKVEVKMLVKSGTRFIDKTVVVELGAKSDVEE